MQYLKRDQNRLTFKDFLLLKSLKPQLATFLLLEVWRKARLVARIYIFFIQGQLCNKCFFLPKLGGHKATFPPKIDSNLHATFAL